MAQKQSRKNGRVGEVIAVSAAAAALAAASYYFLGPKGKQHRHQFKSWSIKMRGEVVEKLERLKDVSEPIYHEVVDAVAAKYARQEGVAKTEVKALAQELKETWRSIVSDARKKPVRRVRRKAKRALAKKTVPRKRRA